MSSFLFLVAVAFATGVLTAMGVGGGSLLMLILISFMGYEQMEAQKVNLIYFIVAGLIAVLLHFKNSGIDKKTAVAAAAGGIPVSIICALLAGEVQPGLLRKAFAIVILAAGIYMLLTGGENRDKTAK